MYLFELLVFKIYVFIVFGCAGSLLLHRLFSNFSKEGFLSACGVQASHCGGFSCWGAQALGHLGFSSCDLRALEFGLSSCSPQA